MNDMELYVIEGNTDAISFLMSEGATSTYLNNVILKVFDNNLVKAVDVLKMLIKLHWNLALNIRCVSEVDIYIQLYNLVEYHNYLWDTGVRNKLVHWTHYRYPLLKFELENKNENIVKIVLYHIICKYDIFINATFYTTTTEIVNNIIKEYTEILNKEDYSQPLPVEISNKNGLNLIDISELLSNPQIELYHKSIRYDDSNLLEKIVKLMYKMEDYCMDKYCVFRLSVIGRAGDAHANLFMYSPRENMWFRVEPAGIRMTVDEVSKYYIELDETIKEFKPNYKSTNDYYYLPGLHKINPGPYCAYYSCMIVNEYVSNTEMTMIDIIEKISNIEYIKQKLIQYNNILTLKI